MYCITNSFNNEVYKIEFSTKEEKTEYVDKEFPFTKKEFLERTSAVSEEEKEKCKKRLFDKRMEFADIMGYKPLPNDKNTLRKFSS